VFTLLICFIRITPVFNRDDSDKTNQRSEYRGDSEKNKLEENTGVILIKQIRGVNTAVILIKQIRGVNVLL
jgi:hypothetical protein